MLEELTNPHVWNAFRQHKAESGHCTRLELARLDAFIEARGYEPLQALVEQGDAQVIAAWFGYPTKHEINKHASSRKRVVFSYPEAQTLCLKLLAHLLYRYDAALSPACYSFRRDLTAKDAWDRLLASPGIDKMFVVKADIHDYFNSIDTQVLARELEYVIDDDPLLLAFLQNLLCDEQAYVCEKLQPCKRGAMAGVPTSAFMANIYLHSLDREFCDTGITYLRYSDDMLILAETREQALERLDALQAHIQAKGLELNEQKTTIAAPGQAWDFLGFKYAEGRLDLSDAVLVKTKAKIKRKARALYRWRKRKDVAYEKAARTMVRIFDKKFYDVTDGAGFTWTRWFFPVLTSTNGLAELDHCFVEYLRYLKTGRHSKANYRVRYEDLKRMGYTSLVGEYYRYRKESRQLLRGTYRSVR